MRYLQCARKLIWVMKEMSRHLATVARAQWRWISGPRPAYISTEMEHTQAVEMAEVEREREESAVE